MEILPKVHILMATYNGERYVAEQLDSMMNQTYGNYKVCIFDDGSSDRTPEILSEYAKKYPEKVILIPGEHQGYPGSFFKLLRECGDADYYGFSDQDDVWLPDKISMAVEKLSQAPADSPNTYFARFAYYDGDLNYIRDADLPINKIPFRKAFFQCYLWGFTVVINEKMRRIFLEDQPVRTKQKDYWIHLLTAAFGNFIYDERICAKHRRHGDNHSQDPTNFIQFQLWRFRYFWKGGAFSGSHDLLKEFYEHFSQRLPEDQRKELELFQGENHRFKKVFYTKRLRGKMTDEILLRIAFLFGKL